MAARIPGDRRKDLAADCQVRGLGTSHSGPVWTKPSRERAGQRRARAKIQATIDSLTQQSKDLVDAAKAVGFEQLNLVEP